MRPRILLAALLGLLPAALDADQKPPATKHRGATTTKEERGLRLGLDADYGDDAHFGVGARAVWGVPGTKSLDLIASVDYFFPPKTEGVVELRRKYAEANANVAYTFKLPLKPYLGTGLNVARRKATLRFLGQDTGTTSGTDVGLNVLGGLRFGERSRFFAEGRYEVKGGDQFVVTAGVLF